MKALIDEVFWRPVVGYEGLYEVSNTGLVRSLDRIETVPAGRHDRPVDRRRRGAYKQIRVSNRGYCIVSLCKEGHQKVHTVHRLVAKAFIENPRNLPEVNHINGDQEDNREVNLEWCTRSKNALHSVRVLGKNRGEDHSRSKLTEADVVEIKRLIDFGLSNKSIAKAYDITHSCISRIRRGRNWSWLTGYGKEGSGG